jgi:hypothetical protein
MTSAPTYESLLAAVVAAPEADAPRADFAAKWSPYDAPWGRLITLQLQRAQRRRAGLDGAAGDVSAEEQQLLRDHGKRWSHTLAKYTRSVTFSRGFIEHIVIEPHLFLEYGAWLLRNAPIRHVGFAAADEGPFPLDALLASPLLAQLDSIDLPALELGDAELERLAASEHLARCLALDLSHNPIGLPAFRALAASPHTRGLLQVRRDGGGAHDYTPGPRLEAGDEEDRFGAAPWHWGPLGADGQALERDFGYLPWLHPAEHTADRFDLRWLVDQGHLPRQRPGQRGA